MEGDFKLDRWLVQPRINAVAGPDHPPIQLEAKVMEVLVYMAEHAGEVVSKEAVLRAVWPDTFVTENSLHHCIAELRKIFQDDAGDPRLIQTIARRGYRLIAHVSKLKGPASRYEIQEKLGQGAMGEVFLAKDTELHRKVALKFVLEEKGQDESSRRRLIREARATAALDHPFICKVFDTGQIEGKTFIAMEYLEGQTLKQKLAKSRIETKEALKTASEIGEALEAAHEKGIVHRDLKPGNIMLTGQGHVKVMDFGLAKRLVHAEGSFSQEDTLSVLTKEGTTAGTLCYMSPEQIRGEAVDHRSDIFSFGIVLYEMLAGVHPFQRKTPMDTASAILNDEPIALGQGLPALPAFLPHIVKRMLAKDAANRYQVVRDISLELADLGDEGEAFTGTLQAGVTGAPQRSSRLGLVACFIMLLAGTVIGLALMRYFRPDSPVPVVTATINVQPGHRLDSLTMLEEMQRPSRTAMAVSSDGKFVVYCAIEEDAGPQAKPRLYLRRMDQSEAKPIAGTEGGINPFLSPDNRWLGFWADGMLKKIPVEGGVATVLCDAASIFGANWGRDNSIVFADGFISGLSRVSAEGGKPEPLTRPDPDRKESSHRLPFWLPNQKGLLFTVMRQAWDSYPWLALLQLDTGDWRVLLKDAADARYVPTGHLVFLKRGTLMAVRFDLARLQVVGQPVAMVENLMQDFSTNNSLNTAAGQFGISDTGALIYAPGGVLPEPRSVLVWVDQTGMEQPVNTSQPRVLFPRLSPDGRRIAYGTSRPEWQIWVYDLGTGATSRLTDEGCSAPIWSPDGKRLLFMAPPEPTSPVTNLFWQPFDGSSPMERLTTSQYHQGPVSWSPDGKTVALVEIHRDSGFDIAVLDVGSGRVTAFLNSQFHEAYPEISPDGHWIAYTSDESGRVEVYVRPFPGPGMKLHVSGKGGREPMWARNGKQLFYRRQDQVWVVDVRTDGGFATGKPRLFFEKSGYDVQGPTRGYDLSLDGKRFLMVKVEQGKPAPVTEMVFVQNWFEELKRLLPAGK